MFISYEWVGIPGWGATNSYICKIIDSEFEANLLCMHLSVLGVLLIKEYERRKLNVGANLAMYYLYRAKRGNDNPYHLLSKELGNSPYVKDIKKYLTIV